MIVKLRRPDVTYPELSPGHQYVVIGIEAGDLRLLNDRGMPYLYPRGLFDLVDEREPADWVVTLGADGERYAYPSPLDAVGFFEDYFDRKPEAAATFWRVVNDRLALAAS